MPTEDKPPSLLEDCLEIFYAPSAVFRRRRDDPAFGGALLLFVLLTIALGFAFRDAIQPLIEADIRRSFAQAMKRNPNIPPEALESSLAMGRKFWLLAAGVMSLLLPLLVGITTWIAGKVVESKAELGHAMMVATYAMLVRIPESVVSALQALLLPEGQLRSGLSVKLGPVRFLDPETANPLLLAVLARVDLGTLWVTAIIAIGISVTGQVSRARGWLAAGLVWLIGAVPGALGALRQM